MVCSQCRNQLDLEDRFCGYCGKSRYGRGFLRLFLFAVIAIIFVVSLWCMGPVVVDIVQKDLQTTATSPTPSEVSREPTTATTPTVTRSLIPSPTKAATLPAEQPSPQPIPTSINVTRLSPSIWRIGNVEWQVGVYRLVSYGTQIEVPMVFHNTAPSTAESIAFDFRLIVDAQEIAPRLIRVDRNKPSYWNAVSTTGEPVNPESTRQIRGDEYLTTVLYFDTPLGWTYQQADSFMASKKTAIRWAKYNISVSITLIG